MTVQNNQKDEADAPSLFPLRLQLSLAQHFFGGTAFEVTLNQGLTVLVGPNGVGKTHALRALKQKLAEALSRVPSTAQRANQVRFVAAGRASPFEHFRSSTTGPNYDSQTPAAVGHTSYVSNRNAFESLVGDMLSLHERADLRIKVEARLYTLFRRNLKLQWTQNGLQVGFSSRKGDYYANTEASGVLHLVGLLSALYDDGVPALLIDEPEISLHPQLQAFLLGEIRRVAGDPSKDPSKKIVVLSTHATSMLPMQGADDLQDLVFFTDSIHPPRQISRDEPLLKRQRLRALIARIGETHRLAFFAQTVLLVEGPSDEIVAAALEDAFELSLSGCGAEVLPVIGKSEFPETIRLFRLMGKRVVVLSDLDALADDMSLIASFSDDEQAGAAAANAGHGSLAEMAGKVKSAFGEAIKAWPSELLPLARGHRYLSDKNEEGSPTERAIRRTALVVILLAEQKTLEALQHGAKWLQLRAMFGALLKALEAAGCFVLTRGTIEDCFVGPTAPADIGKPEAAVQETLHFDSAGRSALKNSYADVLRALEYAAPRSRLDENEFLRRHLAGALGHVFQFITADTLDEDMAATVRTISPQAAAVFGMRNATTDCNGHPAIEIRIVSSLFPRPTFPAIVRRDENLHARVSALLPTPAE